MEHTSTRTTSSSNAPLPPPPPPILTPSEVLFGERPPLDDTTRILCDRIYRQLAASLQVNEIELKIGQLILQSTNHRLDLPVVSECIVSKDKMHQGMRFESSISAQSFEALKENLNLHIEKLEFANQQQAANSSHQQPPNKIHYMHYVEDDEFYEVKNAVNGSTESLRITRDATRRNVKQKIVKQRMEHIEVWSPCTLHDVRVSINKELDMSQLDETKLRKRPDVRRKDRRSYSFQYFRLDATEVTRLDKDNQKKFELEMEIDVKALRYALDRLSQNPKSQTFSNIIADALKLVRSCITVIDRAQSNPSYVEHLRAERARIMQERQRFEGSGSGSTPTTPTSHAPPLVAAHSGAAGGSHSNPSVNPPPSTGVAHPSRSSTAQQQQSMVVKHPSTQPPTTSDEVLQQSTAPPSFQSSMPPPNNLKRKRTQ